MVTDGVASQERPLQENRNPPANLALSLNARLRRMPSVDAALRQPGVSALLAEYPRAEVVRALRAVLESDRRAIRAGQPVHGADNLGLRVREELYGRTRPGLRRVINATGVVLHTNLGRAPLAPEALEAIHETASGYCNLEYDLDAGTRGDRQSALTPMLCELTGAQDAVVVNNNAAATLLALRALASDGEVIVSRGELVEIGGSFRMPDIMQAAGCRLVDVGTTNRTRRSDFERAIGPQTRALMAVHTSSYRVQGFVEQIELHDLVALGRERSIPVIFDLGGGLLRQPTGPGNGSPTDAPFDEPTVVDGVRAGVDLVLFSGDKLLGGPQAGLAVGSAEAVSRMRVDPFARAVRPCKLTLSALEATLRLYRDPAGWMERIPAIRMLRAAHENLEQRARTLAAAVQEMTGLPATAAPDVSRAGGGALPVQEFPTWVVRVAAGPNSLEDLSRELRRGDPPVVCRLHQGCAVLDMRTLSDEDAEQIPGLLRMAAMAIGE